MEAFDLFNSFTLGQNLQPYLLFEWRCGIGTENLYGLLYAIKNRFIVRFTYHKFYDETTTLREVEPYVLKEFKGRWYLVSKDHGDDYIKTFALDRLRGLEITKVKYQLPEEVNPTEHFKNSFGTMSFDDLEPEEIVLAFEPLQGKNIKSYPLHNSQVILVDNETELQVSLKVYQTHYFIMELLSFGEDMRVIGPEGLVNQMKEMISNMTQLYGQ